MCIDDGADGAALVASLTGGAADVDGNGECGCGGGMVDGGGVDISKAVFNISSAAAGCRRFRVVTKNVAKVTNNSDPLDGVI